MRSLERYYGFDLGDAESAISRLEKEEQAAPEVLPLHDARSFVTSYAVTGDGQLLIGEGACYAAGVTKRGLRFKSRFLTDPASAADVKSFAAGVLGELYGTGELVPNDDCCFYIGCPAGWDKNTREDYRAIFERAGYPPVRIISESRAALVSACQSRHLQVGYDILSKPVLVVDIGSSTTDFAYICGGREIRLATADDGSVAGRREAEIETGGEVALGGGIMDEVLLESCVADSENEAAIRRVFAASEPWRTYCEFAARRLKEKFYSDREYFSEHECRESVLIRYDKPIRLVLSMDEKKAALLEEKRVPQLQMRSFRQVFEKSLADVRDSITGEMPELLFLTGGVSRMPSIRRWCRNIFPEAVVIAGAEPEFSVSRGLAWSGRIDDDMRAFRREIEAFVESDKVETIVADHIEELYESAIETLVEPILTNAAEPVFTRWRDGEIERLSDCDAVLEKEIAGYLASEEARELMLRPITEWLKPIADQLEEYTVPICIRHKVPYTALSLSSYLAASDIDIRLDARNLFPVEEITLLIDSIVSILVGLICGGSGIALISSGPNGIFAGVMLSLLVLILGKGRMEKALLDIKLPRPARKLLPANAFRLRIGSMSADVKKSFYESLEEEKNEAITNRMVEEISGQIEGCLSKMAEVVEIPLG